MWHPHHLLTDIKHWKMYRDGPLNNYDYNYRLRLLDLQLLPLMIDLEINHNYTILH